MASYVALLGPAAAVTSALPSAPPWEPDSFAVGTLAFYNTAGSVVTGGTNLSHLFDFAAGLTPATPRASGATLYFAAPNHASSTSNWFVGQASLTSTFPVTSPSSLASLTGPVASLGATDGNLSSFLGGAVLDPTAGYANIIQVRLIDVGIHGVTSSPDYWDADIAYNTGTSAITVDGVTVPAGGWSQIYPVVPVATTTSLKSSANPGKVGTAVKYKATIAPSPGGGTVGFTDNGATISGCKAVAVSASSATATCSVKYTKAGTHKIVAKFSGSGVTEASTSKTLVETVK